MRLDYLLLFLMPGIFEVSCYNYKERGQFFHPQHIRAKRFEAVDKLDQESDSKDLNPNWNSTWTDKLKKVLLLNYDKYARPTHHENVTPVTLGFTMHHIELDEQRSIMKLHLFLALTWQDDKLKWNSSQYGGLEYLTLANHELWQPDIFPYNSASGSAMSDYAHVNILVYADGTVLYVPSAVLQLFCQLDLRKWPFDTQVCPMKMASWTHDGLFVNLTYRTEQDPEFETLVPNSEWKYVKTEMKRNVVYYKCCPEPYINLQFNLTLERRSPAYAVLIITPASAMVLMTLSSFWLPPTSDHKLTLGGVTIFITCLFFLFFITRVSAMGGNTPLIVLFYSSSLYLVSFSVVLSVIIMNISRNPKTFPIPWILKSHLKGWLGKCLLIENFIPSQGSSSNHSFLKSIQGEGMRNNLGAFSEQQDSPESQRIEMANFRSYQHDWLLVAIAIDRIAFLVYCFLFIVFAIAYSV